MQIVLAWANHYGDMVPTGTVEKFDGVNWREKFKPVLSARSCMWLFDGTDADLAKAQAYAENEFKNHPVWRVFVYDNDPNPINRARQEIMELVEQH